MWRTPDSLPARMLTVVAAAIFAGACTSATRSTSTPAQTPSVSVTKRTPSATPVKQAAADPLVVIFMENHERSQVVGSSSAPFQNSMLRRGRDYANYFSITHPSLPNYLAFASGTTNGKDSDEIAAGELAQRPTLWDQLTAAGVDWAVYEETMPSPCYSPYAAGNAPGDYALKHNPAMPFRSVSSDPSKCSNIQPLAAMDPATLPAFSFITPNECNDAHSCPLETGDRWLSRIVPRLVDAGADVIVTYDEGTTDLGSGHSAGGGHVFAAEMGPGVHPGSVVAQPLDHYSLLAGIEDRFGLRPLAGAAHAAVMPT